MENLQADILFYSSPAGNVRVEVIFNDETFWLNQKRLAELFGVEVNTINYHLKEIYKSGELEEHATIRKIRIVQKEGNRDVAREVDFYNLDAAIAACQRLSVMKWPFGSRKSNSRNFAWSRIEISKAILIGS